MAVLAPDSPKMLRSIISDRAMAIHKLGQRPGDDGPYYHFSRRPVGKSTHSQLLAMVRQPQWVGFGWEHRPPGMIWYILPDSRSSAWAGLHQTGTESSSMNRIFQPQCIRLTLVVST